MIHTLTPACGFHAPRPHFPGGSAESAVRLPVASLWTQRGWRRGKEGERPRPPVVPPPFTAHFNPQNMFLAACVASRVLDNGRVASDARSGTGGGASPFPTSSVSFQDMSLCLLEPPCLVEAPRHVAAVRRPPYSAGEPHAPPGSRGGLLSNGAAPGSSPPAPIDPRAACLARKQDVHGLHQTAPRQNPPAGAAGRGVRRLAQGPTVSTHVPAAGPLLSGG